MGRPRTEICPRCSIRPRHVNPSGTRRSYCWECWRDVQREGDRRRKKEIHDHFGNVCNHCGFDDHRALQVDHVNDDGYRERAGRQKAGTGKVLTMVRKMIRNGEDTSRYQLLCANCNWIKEMKRRGHNERSL